MAGDLTTCCGRGSREFTEHPRMTLLGRFLEDLRLAELPQLSERLCQEIAASSAPAQSRRAKPIFTARRCQNYERRQSVRPGITGYAQVYLGSVKGLNSRLNTICIMYATWTRRWIL